MIDSIVKICDRMIQLLETRKQCRSELFINHVEPIFKDLSLIHKDYIQTFSNLLEKCEQNQNTEAIINYLSFRKTELEELRVKVFSYAEVAKNNSNFPDEIKSFFMCCMIYFNDEFLIIKSTEYSGQYTYFIKLVEEGIYTVPPKVIFGTIL